MAIGSSVDTTFQDTAAMAQPVAFTLPGDPDMTASNPVSLNKKRQLVETVTASAKRALCSITPVTAFTTTNTTASESDSIPLSIQASGPDLNLALVPESTNTGYRAASPPTTGGMVRNWFSRRRTKAKLEGMSLAGQTPDTDDVDVSNRDAGQVPSVATVGIDKSLAQEMVVSFPSVIVTSTSSDTPALTSNISTSTSAPTLAPALTLVPRASSTEPASATSEEVTTDTAKKQLSTNGHHTLPEKMTSAEIMKKMARVLRGNAIMAPNDVETVLTLMESAEDKLSRKYIINALMHTNVSAVIAEFVTSRGPQIMRAWFVAAKATPNDHENRDIILRIIAVWTKLPFNYKLLKDYELGKVIRSASKDKNLDDDVVAKALQLEKHWRKMVTEEMDNASAEGANSKPTSSGAKPESSSNKRSFPGSASDGDHPRSKREREDLSFSQASEMKLPKFNKGKSSSSTMETKKTHIMANADFFKELRAPASTPNKPSPQASNKSNTASTPLSNTSASSNPMVRNQTTDSATSQSKPVPSPPTTPTTPTIPTTSVMPATQASITPASNRLSPLPTETTIESTSGIISALVTELSSTVKATVPDLNESKSQPITEPAASVEPDKPIKPKKVVRFKGPDELEMIRYFEPYNATEEKENEDALLRGDMWRPPPMLILEASSERGSKSTEKTVQEKREAETLSVNYIRDAYIPMSPAEPDPDPVDISTTSASAMAVPVFEAATDHSAILMNSLAFLTQVTSSSGSATATTATSTSAISQSAADQSQIGSYGAGYGTGTGYGANGSGYGTGASGYGTGASSYATGGAGYGTGAIPGYGTGAASYGAGAIGSYGNYGAGAAGTSSFGTGSTTQTQAQQQQQQAYPYLSYQPLQQASQAAFNSNVNQAYNYNQQYQQTPATATSVSTGTTSNMDPLALIEMTSE
ncbi:hypothetical protein FBU30_000830 [Linnemannia zychae]|nr:hypothetical protein FBU30_000830 [Linnemannia zychae]